METLRHPIGLPPVPLRTSIPSKAIQDGLAPLMAPRPALTPLAVRVDYTRRAAGVGTDLGSTQGPPPDNNDQV